MATPEWPIPLGQELSCRRGRNFSQQSEIRKPNIDKIRIRLIGIPRYIVRAMSPPSSQPLALSANARISQEAFGAENQPMLMIDGALNDPAAVIEIAARQSYRQIGPYYPGLRAPVPEPAAWPLLQPAAALIASVFNLKRAPIFEECYLSVITAQPDELTTIQKLPHFDGTESDRLAVLLYLDRAEQGGTAFYRQRSTGFESITEARLPDYEAALAQGMREHGRPTAGYLRGDTPLFEQIHTVAGVHNRAIIYRGNTLHCGLLGKQFKPKADPCKGRLTLNMFFA